MRGNEELLAIRIVYTKRNVSQAITNWLQPTMISRLFLKNQSKFIPFTFSKR